MLNTRPDWQSWPVATGSMHRCVLTLAIVALISGCEAPTEPSSSSVSSKVASPASLDSGSTPHQSAATEFLTGERAAKFIMRAHSTEGSFDPLIDDKGYAAPTGHKANRVFTPAGNLIVDADIDSWPTSIKWIKNFEVGITGENNTYLGSSTQHNCARFASTTTDGIASCDWDGIGGSGAYVPCGAQDGYYRVSETNCKNGLGNSITGAGAETDNIFIRLELDRTRLSSSENLMIVVEYAAANVNRAPESPTTCYNSTLSLFDPTQFGCSDQSWQIFLKKNETDTVTPFLTLVPPAFSFIDTVNHRGGAGVTSRQIIFPIAGDPELDYIQFSRMTGNPNAGGTICPSNSALCHGTVYYSLTVFRI